jgi:hypothetical protein
MAVLLIETVTCIATEDLIGEDDLRGVLGLSRFSIGRFKDGDSTSSSQFQTVSALCRYLRRILRMPMICDTIDLTQDERDFRSQSFRHTERGCK